MLNILTIALGLMISLLLSKLLLNLVKDGGLSVVNYRGEEVPIALGIGIICCIFITSIILHLISVHYVDFKLLLVYSGVFIIGFLDDVLQDKENKGFKGHFKAAFKGKLTTGFLKAIGIPIILLFYFKWDNYLFIIDLIFVSLIVNLFNFFDLRPGRCQKIFLLFNLALLFFVDEVTAINLSIIGIVAYTLILDLREWGMLGDSGSNLLGIIIGMQLINLSVMVKATIYSMILLLTIIGEKYSFTKIIKKSNFLNYLDQLGRIKE